MKAEVNGMTIWGTADELADLIGKIRRPEEAVKIPKAEKAVKKELDWGKAKSLLNAGWKWQEIADEIGTTASAVARHFKKG